jgi:hypothetical protein
VDGEFISALSAGWLLADARLTTVTGANSDAAEALPAVNRHNVITPAVLLIDLDIMSALYEWEHCGEVVAASGRLRQASAIWRLLIA